MEKQSSTSPDFQPATIANNSAAQSGAAVASAQAVNMVDRALRQQLVEHCAGKINDCPVDTTPFPHFCVQGFFPADFYQELLAELPEVSLYRPFAYETHKTETGDANRFRFQMSNVWLDQLPARQQKLWFTVRSVLGGQELKAAVFQKLSPGLKLRFGVNDAEVQDLPGFALPELFHETEGYSIKPHPDTRRKVVTMQLALADNESQRELGTEFYRRSLDVRRYMSKPRGFETVKKMPFTPNTVYAFSVLNTLLLKSWHGRTKLPGDYGVRNSLLNIWYAKAENSDADVVADSAYFATQSKAHSQAA